MSQADDFRAFGKKDWSLKVEPASMSPKRPVMYTPGPVDVKTYEVSHEDEANAIPTGP